jgi:3-oxoacyl-[acyl-carrier protein] reductase
MGELSGKTALVTGASQGIGRAIAQRLGRDGAVVAVHYRSEEAAAHEVVMEIKEAGADAFPVSAELGVEGDVDALFAGLEAGFGTRPLDILVNNAGVTDWNATIEHASPEAFDRSFAINVRAPFFIIQRALPRMADGGRIINISSGVTWFAVPEVVYAMTKAALNALSRSLAQTQGGRNITVNAVAPGITDTAMNSWLHDEPGVERDVASIVALGRVGRPEDIADVVAFLASDDARWITGQTVDVNGGLLLGPRR